MQMRPRRMPQPLSGPRVRGRSSGSYSREQAWCRDPASTERTAGGSGGGKSIKDTS